MTARFKPVGIDWRGAYLNVHEDQVEQVVLFHGKLDQVVRFLSVFCYGDVFQELSFVCQ